MNSRPLTSWLFSLAICIYFFAQSGLAQQPQTAGDAPTRIRLVPIHSGMVTLAPDNTTIQFIGTHVGDDPKPRLGGFTKFDGNIEVDGGAIKSIEVEIDVTSLWTQFPKLTAHLKTADFFNAEKFGKSKFKSTKITPSDGQTMVTGNFTLMGVTKKLSFPVQTTTFDGGFSLTSKFEIDRTLWGMDKMTEGVNPDVAINVVVGQQTNPPKTGN